jgi:hypothetical protein
MIGIAYLYLHSICMRRSLKKTGLDLDKDFVSPADFAVYAQNLDKNMTQDELKQEIEQKYGQVKVIYINFCYNIDEMIKVAAELTQLYRYLGIYKNKREIFLKDNNKSF